MQHFSVISFKQFFQHCCAQRVVHAWLPCNNMLQDVAWWWNKFENGKIFVETLLNVARCCARLASSFTLSRSTIH